MILAVNTNRNNIAALRSVHVARALGRSASARRVVAALSGLGYDAGTLPGLISSYANSFTYGIASKVEQGTPTDPAVVAQTLASAAQNFCADQLTPGVCDPATVQAQIQAAVASYAAALQAKQDTFASQVAAGQVVVPQGSYVLPAGYSYDNTGGGGATAYATPPIAPAPTYPTTVVPTNTVPTGGGVSTVPVTTPVQASLRNLSRPNQTFQVGDLFSLDVQGAPGALVTITATKNGQALGTTPYGNTDSTGRRSITGTMDATTVGSWVEVINVGGSGAAPYTLQFNVTPASGAGGGSTGPTGGGTSTATQVAADGTTNTNPPAPAPASGGFSIGGVTLSTPMLIGLAAAAFFFFGGKR